MPAPQKHIKRLKQTISFELTQSELLAPLKQIYANRGVHSLEEVDYRLEFLTPPHGLSDIKKATDRLCRAILKRESILIVGDFDCDGATSTALAVTALHSFGAENVNFLVPNRFEFGYGLSPALVEVAAQLSPDIIVTVDNGISSIVGVDCANEHGIDVIVTDHHLPGKHLPNAYAIVNPNHPGKPFHSGHLAGVGVIFYLMLSLRALLDTQNWFQMRERPNMADLLDFVALGTVADLVPLDKTNRTFVDQGLRRIRNGQCSKGISALIQLSGREQSRLTSSDLAFALAPRLNAAGRLDDMSVGIQCLLAQDETQALEKATILDGLNKERRTIEADMQKAAFNIVERLENDNTLTIPSGLVLYEASWHQGVIGIVAGRLKEYYHRPTIVFAREGNGKLKGSGRSIPGCHLRDVLARIDTLYPGLILQFGGHAMAAGLGILETDINRFTTIFDDVVNSVLTEENLKSVVHSDGELDKTYFNLNFAKQLRDAGPWGQAFSEPLFDGVFEIVEQRIVGSNHLKLRLVVPGTTQLIDAIAFNIQEAVWPNHRCIHVEIAYRLDINVFQGNEKIQLIIEQLEAVRASVESERFELELE